jgi:hypothetical protein
MTTTTTTRRAAAVIAAAVALALVVAACGSDSSSASSGPASIRITAPSEGASVPQRFTLRLESSLPIGRPSTGRHHVHLYYDGNRTTNMADYDIVYGSSFTVTRLSPGHHTIEAVVANADHSTTTTRDEISVDVAAASGATGGPASSTTTSTTMGDAYGY